MKKIVALFALATFLFPQVTSANVRIYDTLVEESVNRMEEIGVNPIDQAIVRMVHNKIGRPHIEIPSESFSKTTALRRQRSGGFFVSSNESSDLLDLFTGAKAIDESLQLGSINRNVDVENPEMILAKVEEVLDLYFETYEQYPESLKDFSREAFEETGKLDAYNYEIQWERRWYSLNELADIFSYSSTGESYQLEMVSPTVDMLTPVEIESHPWEEMLEGRSFENIELARFSPKDSLFLHFQNPDSFLEFENLVKELSKNSLQNIYTFTNLAELRPQLLENLGIPSKDFLIGSVENMAFISTDFDFVPANDYALVFQFENAAAKKGFEILHSAQWTKTYENTVVVASSEAYLQDIENAFATEENLYAEKDFQYMLSVIENRRDGILYFSDAFIRKLTGPEYRILARKRNVALSQLETLQYMVFAYKSINGVWPDNFEQIQSEEFADFTKFSDISDFGIDSQTGKVLHKTWGDIWNITPIHQVRLGEVSVSDFLRYQNFSREYQSYFTEFFDPVGIAFTVSDQIMFHTIILPLIEQSEYNFLKDIFNNSSNVNILESSHRLGVFNIIGGIDFDSILIENYKQNNDETDENTQLSNEEIIRRIESDFLETTQFVKKADEERIFDFIGEKMFVGIDLGDFPESQNELDAWIGISLKDVAKAKRFMKQISLKTDEELGSYRDLSGLFAESNQKTYKNTTYYIDPSSFITLYYGVVNSEFYIAASEISMKNIIDSQNSPTAIGNIPEISRNVDYIGNSADVFVNFHLKKALPVLVEELHDQNNFIKRETYSAFQDHMGYLHEVNIVEDILGENINIEDYYSYIPKSFYGHALERKNDEVFYTVDGKTYNTKDIDTTITYFEGDKSLVNAEKISLGEILEPLVDKNFLVEEMLGVIEKYASSSINMKFTEHGLDVRISMNNPYEENFDERFEVLGGGEFTGGKRDITLVLLGMSGVLVVAIFGIIFISRKK